MRGQATIDPALNRGLSPNTMSPNTTCPLILRAIDNVTGLPKTYYWMPGMKSIRERNE